MNLKKQWKQLAREQKKILPWKKRKIKNEHEIKERKEKKKKKNIAIARRKQFHNGRDSTDVLLELETGNRLKQKVEKKRKG